MPRWNSCFGTSPCRSCDARLTGHGPTMDMALHDLLPPAARAGAAARGCAILVLEPVPHDRQRDLTYVLSLVALAAAAARPSPSRSTREVVMSGTSCATPLADALKVAVFVVTGWPSLFRGYLQRAGFYRGEFLCARAVRGAGHERHGLGRELSQRLPGPRADRPEPLCAGRLRPRLGRRLRRPRSSTSCSARSRRGCCSTGISMVYGACGALDFATVSETLRETDTIARSWCSAWCSSSSASPSSSGRCRSTCGCRTSTTARRHR